MADLIVHGGLPSPFVRKVLLCLEEKGLAYEQVPLAPFPKTPELLALNPLGRIPILQHGDFTLADSSAIALYLEKIQPTPALFPSDPREYGRALFLEEYADTRIIQGTSPALFHGLIRPMFFQQPGDMAAVDKSIAEELGPALDWLEPRVDAPTGLVNGRHSIADIACATQLMGLPYAKRELDAARWPRIAQWYATTRARPAWKRIEPKEFPFRADLHAALERVFREEAGVVLGALVAQVHDLDLAEDAFADAVTAALEHWPSEGVPARPGAWLLTAARRKALDRLRRRATRLEKQHALEIETRLAERASARADEDMGDEEVPDERLRLIFTCCDPALSRQAQLALTLKTLGGLSTAEIARAFLIDEPAMARRLVRAKARLREIGARYRVPEVAELPARCEVVLAVVYLIFNEGYAATAGDHWVRRELCAEAIRLARLLAQLLPEEREIRALLALMLLHDARRDARQGADGMAVPLEEQDRARWSRAQIDEGRALLAALDAATAGPYELQARIAAEHVLAPRFADTDWRRIVTLYDRLLALQDSPVVALSRAIALGLAESPEAGLALLADPALERALAGYAPLTIARADLLRRAGRTDEARAAYREALEITVTAPERAFLARRLAEL